MLKRSKACEQYLLFGQTNVCGQAKVHSPGSTGKSKIHCKHKLDCVLTT